MSTKIQNVPDVGQILGRKYQQKLNFKQGYFTDSTYFDPTIIQDKEQLVLVKGSTGYGGTTAALNDTRFCNIVATPNTSHVINKQKTIGANGGAAGYRIFYIYQDSNDRWSSVLNYLKTGRKFHVYTTFKNLHTALTNYENEITSDKVRLVIDEYQQLYALSFTDYIEDFNSKILGFEGLVLTSATFHKFKHHKGLSNLPLNVIYKKEHIKRRAVDYVINAKVGNVIEQIKRNLEANINTYVFTNEIDIFKSQINADTITGATLGLKIAFYSDANNSHELDPSKNIHIISSSAYEGIDIYEKDCEVLIYGSYNHSGKKDHLLIGENDLYQITGRFRNGYKKATLFIDKANGFDEWLDSERAEILNLESKLDKTQSTNIAAYYSQLPSLSKAAQYDKKLDVYDLIRSHKFSVRFDFKVRSVNVITKRNLAKVQPSIALKRIGLKEAHAVASDPTRFLGYRIIDNEDKSKRTGYHSGLNIDDILLYLIRDFIGEDKVLLKTAKQFDSKTNQRRGRSELLKSVYDVLSFFVLSNEYGAYFKNVLADRNFNEDYLSSKASRFNSFQRAFLQCLDSVTRTNLGTLLREVPKTYKLDTQLTEAQATQLKNIGDRIFNFVWLYNTRLTKGTEIRHDLENAIAKYAQSDKYKTKKEEDRPTISELIKQHKSYLLDVFLSLHNLTEQIAIVKADRAYSTITAHPSDLRKITPSKFVEVDFRQLNPRIAAMWLDSQGHSELLNKIRGGDIYKIKSKTRDEGKRMINTVLNLHSKHKTRDKSLIQIGLSTEAAQLWARTFARSGSFFEFATKVERKLVEAVADYYRDNLAEGYRLHDAYIVQGQPIDTKHLKEVTLEYQGEKYTFPLGSTDWN